MIYLGVSKEFEKIKGFSNLNEGWNYGEGNPISEEVIRLALGLSYYAKNHNFEQDAFPDPDGGILISVYYENKCLDIYIDNNLSMEVILEKDDVEIYSLNTTYKKVVEIFINELEK